MPDEQQIEPARVGAPPLLPTIVYDGECAFCRRSVARWKAKSGDAVEYLSYQKDAWRFPQVPVEELRSAVHLIEPDGRVSRGAEAVLRSGKFRNESPIPLWAYEHIPPVRAMSEACYRFIASYRGLANFADLALLGANTLPVKHQSTRRWFLRLLGVIYLIAFGSLWPQINGLVGSRGILPIADKLREASANGAGFFQAPTLLWFNSSDAMLGGLCAAGMAMGFMLIFRIAPVLSAFGAWLCYLSLTVAGQIFCGYQWDGLLLEAGFLAIFLSPLQWAPHPLREPPVSRIVIWLYRWLLFRLIFLAGLVKLTGGDPTWHDLTALQFHYWTQPLPPWTAWFFNFLPNWFQQFSVVCVFFAELVVPWFFFAPRQLRKLAFIFTVALQLLIIVSGNYGFFNWLTIVLSLLLLDDTFWPFKHAPAVIKVIPRPTAANVPAAPIEGTPLDEPPPIVLKPVWKWPAFFTVPLAAFLVLMTCDLGIHGIQHTSPVTNADQSPFPLWVERTSAAVAPFRSTNPYGLFESMTTHRPEIIIEGSNDGINWKAYEFKYKPGDVKRRPEFCAPYMPRLDWQMWFAGSHLRNGSIDDWLPSFFKRLLDGSPQVADLMEKSPFNDHPPRMIRATVYMYEFTTFSKGNSTGDWWWTFKTGTMLGPVRLDANGQFSAVTFTR